MSRRRLAPIVLLALALSGCGSSAATEPTFRNPVYRHDFPDPSVLRVGATYYAYATNAGLYHIPVLTSTDLVHWQGPHEAMPAWAPWEDGLIWAPSVVRRSVGRYLMYYTAHDIASARQCIGVAEASRPTGPFHDGAHAALLCPLTLGGAIDPAAFRDADGTLYLYWKNDGNCCGIATHIFVQRLSADGLRLVSGRRSLAVNDQTWEGAVIEGPTMWQQNGTYYLFYSGGDYATSHYGVGYSTCRGPLGPCTPSPRNPIVHSRCRAAGPGGETIVQDRTGTTWMLYHAWPKNAVNTGTPGRLLWLDRLNFRNGVPTIHGPTCGVQVAPAG